MRRFSVIPLLILLVATACSQGGVSARLDQAESLLEASPDSALTVLEGIRPERLSGRDKARHALLSARSFAEVYGFYSTDDEPALSDAAAWFERKGPRADAMRAWYCLGRIQQAREDWNRAVVSLTKAERAARETGDLLFCGRIASALADTYSATLSETLSARKQYEAFEAYTRAGDAVSARRALQDYGDAFRSLGRLDDAQTVYQQLLADAHAAGDTLGEVRCLEAMAALSLERDAQDPDFAIDLLGRVTDQLHARLSSEDLGVLAYAWALKGQRGYSEYWLRRAAVEAETPAQQAEYQFRRYQICARAGRSAEALEALEAVSDYANRVESRTLRQSALTSQLDYLAKQEALEASRARNARMSLWALILLIAGIAASLLWYAKARRMQQQRVLAEEQAETERYMSLAEDLQARLSRMQEKDRAPAVPKLDVLERLCEQYYVYEGTDNLQPKLMKEVRAIVDGLRSDPKVHGELEASLNRSADGVMTRLRAAFPSWKDEDFRLYAFAAAGFSPTTMSLLLEKDKPYIYNRIYRLKGRIGASDSPDKDFFLEKIGKTPGSGSA